MKKFKNRSLVGIVITLSIAVCDAASLPQGHFEGNLLEKSPQGAITQELVSADISFGKKGVGEILVREELTGVLVSTVQIPILKGNRAEVMIPSVLLEPASMTKDKTGCFRSELPTEVSFCETQASFTLEVDDGQNPVFVLSGAEFDPEGKYQMEAPKAYALSDAIKTALQQNFDSQIEFEHVMEAKGAAKAAYLNLLPHLSFSDLANNLAPSVGSILGSLGDICPFLFPTRWIEAKNAALSSDSEKLALTLMQLDTASQLEQLTYSYAHDQAVVALYRYLIAQAETARAASWAIESAGTFPAGSTAHLDAALSSLNLDLSAYNELLTEDRSSIAQAMGLNNPDGVTDVTFVDTIDWTQASPMDAQPLTQVVVDRSFELQQMDDLLKIGKNQKKATYFNWLDPSGDYTQDLGFNLRENLAVDKDEVNELGIRKQEIEAGIVQNLFSTIDGYNQQAADYGASISAVQLSKRRLATAVAQLVPGSSFDTMDIEGILQDYLSTGLRKETLLWSLRISKAQVDRLLLQGFYATSTPQMTPR